MKKQAVIKSERSLKMVTNLVAKKVANRLWRYKTYQVEVKELVKGKINHVIIKNERSHMLTKYAIDDAWVVIDEYEKKYAHNCVYGTIQTRPYLTEDLKDLLSMPVIEICVRVHEDEE